MAQIGPGIHCEDENCKPTPQCVQSLAWSGHDWDATGSHIQHEHAGRTSEPFSITKLTDDQRQELAVA
jgi:hypothetical protein